MQEPPACAAASSRQPLASPIARSERGGENATAIWGEPTTTEAMAIGHLRAVLVFLLVQVCLFLMMVASARVQGRPLGLETTPQCCLYHPDCCQRLLTAEAPLAAAVLP
ncbi:hypothetical protein ZWY2020_045340 [Hordeum vulgare]|nr:hypothetical protein ZWY2020_045340 [Hordeum vulgare]